MRFRPSVSAIWLALALAIGPQPGRTQPDRDFVFTDSEGHLVIRFAGTGERDLAPSQREELVNAELSSMVHDRLRADLLFEAEPPDVDWARSMEPQIEARVERFGPEFSARFVECRAASCRIIMEQPAHSTVAQHEAMLETVQESLEAFLAARRQYFRPVFMIAAYDQETETPHIKVFLRRNEQAGRARGGARHD